MMQLSLKRNAEGYFEICVDDLPNYFLVENENVSLKNSWARPITIAFPLVLDEKVARIAAMVLDGSMAKNMSSVQFSQKKDKAKVNEFGVIFKSLFGLTGKIRTDLRNDVPRIDFGSKVLCYFLSMCFDIHKSDEGARIPWWIWESPKSVQREYLRYAFAMEGSVRPHGRNPEIRFHSVVKPHVKEMQRMLKESFSIDSKIFSYEIKDYGWKYYLLISDSENIRRFQNIGFALESHEERLHEAIEMMSNKAWEITLVELLDWHNRIFSLKEAQQRFQKLCRRAVHQRLVDLIALGYLHKQRRGYAITSAGFAVGWYLLDEVKMTKLRTNPRENEQRVFTYLQVNGQACINEIAQALDLNRVTTRDVLKRLEAKDAVWLREIDRFQRKIFSIW